MHFLKEWGAHILVSQIVVGMFAGVAMAFYGDSDPVKFALSIAALVAVFYSVIVPINVKGVALASLSMFLVILCIISGLKFAAFLLALAGLSAAAVAAVFEKTLGTSAEEGFLPLVIDASPVGALMCLIDRLDKEQKKIFGK